MLKKRKEKTNPNPTPAPLLLQELWKLGWTGTEGEFYITPVTKILAFIVQKLNEINSRPVPIDENHYS